MMGYLAGEADLEVQVQLAFDFWILLHDHPDT